MIIELKSSSGRRIGVVLNKIIAIIENNSPTTPVRILLDNDAVDVAESYDVVTDKIAKATMVNND